MSPKSKHKRIPHTYLGPIQLFAHLNDGDTVTVEQHCNYERKSYRNRCNIVGANGLLSLSVPVSNIKNSKVVTKEASISYDTEWQKQHWRSIVSAYNGSPFFEYYADDFEPFYNKPITSLLEFNMGLFNTVIESLELDIEIKLSESYKIEGNNIQDLRPLILSKNHIHLDEEYQTIEYRQVFREKHGFIPNLSILDLIFNKGPESIDILSESLKA